MSEEWKETSTEMDKLQFGGIVLPKDGTSFNITINNQELELRDYGVENTRFSLSVINSVFQIEWDCPQTYKAITF